MNKKCSSCKEILPITNFNKKSTRLDGSITHQPYCKECNKVSSRKYYAENREAHIKEIYRRRKIYIAGTHELMIQYLLTHPCVDCSNHDIRVLEFDHLRDKECDISIMIQSRSWKSILAEIEKCEVVCSNCHKIRTHTRSENYKYRGWLEFQSHLF